MKEILASKSATRLLAMITVVTAVLLTVGCLVVGPAALRIVGIAASVALVCTLVYVTSATRHMRSQRSDALFSAAGFLGRSGRAHRTSRHLSETTPVPERSYRWKRNKQLIFLGAFLLVLACAVWMLLRGYSTGWLFTVAAVLGVLQPVFVLWSLQRFRRGTTTEPKRDA